MTTALVVPTTCLQLICWGFFLKSSTLLSQEQAIRVCNALLLHKKSNHVRSNCLGKLIPGSLAWSMYCKTVVVHLPRVAMPVAQPGHCVRQPLSTPRPLGYYYYALPAAWLPMPLANPEVAGSRPAPAGARTSARRGTNSAASRSAGSATRTPRRPCRRCRRTSRRASARARGGRAPTTPLPSHSLFTSLPVHTSSHLFTPLFTPL